MHGQTSLKLFVAIGLVLLASCAGIPSQSMPDPIELPIRSEPVFKVIGEAELPSAAKMARRVSAAELVAVLKTQFPELASNRASLTLMQEQWILSDTKLYRRTWFSYADEATSNMHGACDQNIYLWSEPSGDTAGVYTQELSCPI
jgi:hypothetical protein